MNKKILKHIEKILIEQKERTKKELESFAEKNEKVENDYNAKFPQYGDHEDENASEVADFESDLYLEKTLERTLKKIDEALKKMKKGNYGKCEKCEKAIPEKRCLAFPAASKCMDCKKKSL